MRPLQITLLVASLISFSSAETEVEPIKTCGITYSFLKCPQGLNPCCSQFGQCGTGAFCLGGCDPRYSATQDSCLPSPKVLEPQTSSLSSKDRITPAYQYLGDATKTDWIIQQGGETIIDGNNGITLIMGNDRARSGTVVSSAGYIWYGRVKAKIRSSRGNGVVTGFMLFGNTRDEIDWEWTGNVLGQAQTNFYYQGLNNHNNSFRYPDLQKPSSPDFKQINTFSEWHDYEIDWSPESIKWSLDGVVIREKKKSDTLQPDGLYHYPQTPCRVQFSIWAGGAKNAPTGQRDWAGGEVDWANHPDIKEKGYYYASVKDVTITPYDAPSDAKVDGKTSFTWVNPAKNWTYDEVIMTDLSTVLASPISNGQPSTKVWSLVSDEELKMVETLPGLVGTGRVVLGGSMDKDGVISAYSAATRVVVARLAIVAAVFAFFI
ncbi:concanavalin A-like lectin/glucanase domain-containing protein [Pyronema omphalodes]|nr:concanavalin A-like lectin/glucanase domain-containing protein [Pyronema omphalodes]